MKLNEKLIGEYRKQEDELYEEKVKLQLEQTNIPEVNTTLIVQSNPDSEFEMFTCSACAEDKCLAGSIQYSKYRLCNDCVLMYETALKLNKIKNIDMFMN